MPRDPLPAWFIDEESLQARWVTPEQLPNYPLRNPDVESKLLPVWLQEHLPIRFQSWQPRALSLIGWANTYPYPLK
ncbi:MAG: hypothetical protein ACPLUL_13300 [Thermanaerothrix sp.]|uniref:hypothetical protein n=1 Tax=Thermanaerothrix sp. TaxID=2972675 RepID=UPI003C7ADD7D